MNEIVPFDPESWGTRDGKAGVPPAPPVLFDGEGHHRRYLAAYERARPRRLENVSYVPGRGGYLGASGLMPCSGTLPSDWLFDTRPAISG